MRDPLEILLWAVLAYMAGGVLSLLLGRNERAAITMRQGVLVRGADAAMLGLKRTTLLSRMQRMGIDIKDVLETRGQSLPA